MNFVYNKNKGGAYEKIADNGFSACLTGGFLNDVDCDVYQRSQYKIR